jgi:hypothetical protein
VTIAALPTVTPGTDVGDTLATALAVTLPINNQVTIAQSIGDNAFGNRDADLYRLTANAGDTLSLDATRLNTTSLDLQWLSLNADGLALTPNPVVGPDATDGLITIGATTETTPPTVEAARQTPVIDWEHPLTRAATSRPRQKSVFSFVPAWFQDWLLIEDEGDMERTASARRGSLPPDLPRHVYHQRQLLPLLVPGQKIASRH